MKNIISILLFIVILFTSCNSKNTREKSYMVSIDTIGTKIVKDKQDPLQILKTNNVADSLQLKTLEDVIKKEENKIGSINHIVKDTMEYDVSDTVEMTISYNCPKEIIVDNVKTFKKHKSKSKSKNNVVTQTIKITPEMRARLIDPSGESFIIIPVTDTVQIVEMKDSTYTLWQWRVKPINYGDQNLVLSVDMIIDGYKKSIKIYQDKIFVHIGFWTKAWNFIQLYWEYLTYAVTSILAIIAWLYKKQTVNFLRKVTRMKTKKPE